MSLVASDGVTLSVKFLAKLARRLQFTRLIGVRGIVIQGVVELKEAVI
jgi:hypothetical protein